ncbi:serine hydrolase domain-containing protein [Streptomyces hiroshimensis]|uniref:serine hydrolase domain-containing protein n=1 Tax=Streptomyces hiroshimensis TaxID=66424 RepID=UPI001671BEBB|nr:serine hydrolase domain-containing protein [Streptomyces hiroshimensis]
MRLRSVVAAAALAVGLALPPGTAAAATAAPAPPAGLDAKALQAALDKLTAAGAPAALAEVRVGDQRWSGASGVRDVRSEQPARPGDRYRVASVTKSMVATVVMQLADEGKLKLDDPVAKHLPGMLPYKEPINLRQLLNHTSGIPDYLDDLYPTGSLEEHQKNRFRYFAPQGLIKNAVKRPLADPSSPDLPYSNTNYALLGLVVEKVTGKSLGTELTRRVFRPAGMRDTSYPTVNPFLSGPHVNGYIKPENGPLVDATDYTPSVWGAAAAVVSTSADLNRFFRALSDGTLLSPARLAEMRQQGGKYPYYTQGLMAGGDLCPARPGELMWGNRGNGFGYRSMSFSSPDGRRQVSFGWTVSAPGVAGPPAVEKAWQEFLLAALGATCGRG